MCAVGEFRQRHRRVFGAADVGWKCGLGNVKSCVENRKRRFGGGDVVSVAVAVGGEV